MARRYSATVSATDTANVTLMVITSTAAIRPRIYDFIIGSPATPADQASDFTWNRTTAAGTTTAFTPLANDPGDPAATAIVGVPAITGEPTYTANSIIWSSAINQRATFRWVAFPNGELVLPATAANGAGLRAVATTSAYTVRAQVYWEE